jgi:hypothetical protein
VVGECGDGKSSLINSLTKSQHSIQIDDNPEGVTKECACYRMELSGAEIVVIDTPGVGDCDVNPQQLIVMIEQILQHVTVQGVIITSKDYTRVKLGGALVAKIINLAFKSQSKWDSVIFVFTHGDSPTAKPDNIPKVLQIFNEKKLPPGGNAHVYSVTASPAGEKPNITDLINKMTGILATSGVGAFTKPEAQDLAGVLCDEMGIERQFMGSVVKELEALREMMSLQAETMKQQQELMRQQNLSNERMVKELTEKLVAEQSRIHELDEEIQRQLLIRSEPSITGGLKTFARGVGRFFAGVFS